MRRRLVLALAATSLLAAGLIGEGRSQAPGGEPPPIRPDAPVPANARTDATVPAVARTDEDDGFRVHRETAPPAVVADRIAGALAARLAGRSVVAAGPASRAAVPTRLFRRSLPDREIVGLLGAPARIEADDFARPAPDAVGARPRALVWTIFPRAGGSEVVATRVDLGPADERPGDRPGLAPLPEETEVWRRRDPAGVYAAARRSTETPEALLARRLAALARDGLAAEVATRADGTRVVAVAGNGIDARVEIGAVDGETFEILHVSSRAGEPIE